MFPVVQRWPFLLPPIANPPSSFANRSIHNSHPLAIRGCAFVIPRSARIRSIQLVERYFGWYKFSSASQAPLGRCLARISEAQPLLPIWAFDDSTSGSSSGFPINFVSVRDRIDGSSGSSNQVTTLFGGFVATAMASNAASGGRSHFFTVRYVCTADTEQHGGRRSIARSNLTL